MSVMWNDVVSEIMTRKIDGRRADILSCDEQKIFDINRICKKKERIIRSLGYYKLGNKYGNLYFTRREAECMVWLLRGKTIGNVAKLLDLSPRTVEYYIKNMKIKVGCRTKFDLIDIVYESEFMKNIDF